MMRNLGCKHRGHTLIELIVSLAVVSILVLAAIPLFDSYSDQTRIDELKAVILRAAASQEKHFSSTGNYAASASLLHNYDFPAVPNSKMKLFTGVIMRTGTGMTYWVNGSYDIGGASRACWLYLGSTMGTSDDSNFMELKPSDPAPYDGVNCN
jgi:prepilin-type N-terminal cleavage/methylation domain-containing protein